MRIKIAARTWSYGYRTQNLLIMKNVTRNISALVLFTALLLIPGFIKAQSTGFHYGARFGLGESKVNLENTSATNGKLALSLGAATTYRFNDYLGLNADFLFTSKGGTMNGAVTESVLGVQRTYTYEDRFNLFYAELPVTGQLRLPLSDDFALKAFVGPSVNFKLLALQSRQYDDDDYDRNNGYSDREMDRVETMEYTLVYGAGIEVQGQDSRTFFIDFRRNDALDGIGFINNQRALSKYFLISAGYLF